MVFQISQSNRGMFDPDDDVLPQGIFDVSIFDTQEAEATVTHILLPAFVHSISTIEVFLASKELIVVK